MTLYRRAVVASPSLLSLPDRVNWKDCKVSEDEEKEMTGAFTEKRNFNRRCLQLELVSTGDGTHNVNRRWDIGSRLIVHTRFSPRTNSC